jgi:hypothetical protein
MLIRAIVSGDGERRMSSGRSSIGEEGTEEVKGRDVRFSGSGRLNGAGLEAETADAGGGGRR